MPYMCKVNPCGRILCVTCQASHIWEWLRLYHPTDLQDNVLRQLWGSFKEWCRAEGHSAPPGGFSYSALGSPTAHVFPELSSTFKAETVRIITAWIAVHSQKVEPGDTPQSRARLVNAWSFAKLQSACLHPNAACG